MEIVKAKREYNSNIGDELNFEKGEFLNYPDVINIILGRGKELSEQ